MAIQKNKLRHLTIPPSSLSVEHFTKILRVVQTANEEAKSFELDEIEKAADPSLFKRDQAKAALDKHLVIQLGVFGSDGEYVQTDDLNDINDLNHPTLPDSISRVELNNKSKYKLFAERNPFHYFELTLDFRAPKILDLNSSPTRATENDSSVNVLGINNNWVDGTFSALKKIFDEAKSGATIFHRHAVYDLVLWLIYVPLVIYALFRIDIWAMSKLGKLSPGLQFTIYLYMLVFSLLVFRFAFNYARWLYPYFELQSRREKKRALQRTIYISLVSAVAASATYDLLKFLLLN